ncbi:MAG: polysaccharide deacetylase, partial [Parcubacteria group bacterium Gr01-1014_70]
PSLEIDADADNIPDNWFKGGWGTNTHTFTYPVAGASGVDAAKVEITSYTSGDAKWYFADAPVLADQDYAISHDYNSDINSEIVIRYTKADGSVFYTFVQSLPSTAGTWQHFEKVATIPSDVVSMSVFHVIANVGSLTIDTYSVKRVPVYVDPSQVLEIAAAGHEVGGHTRTHADLTTLTSAEQQNEIGGSRTDLLDLGITPVDTFLYPEGAYNPEVIAHVQSAGYIAARSVDRGFNTPGGDVYTLKIQAVGRVTTLSEVQNWIDQAIANKVWLILMFHQIDNDPTATFGTTPEILQSIVDYSVSSGIDVVTMREGAALMD